MCDRICGKNIFDNKEEIEENFGTGCAEEIKNPEMPILEKFIPMCTRMEHLRISNPVKELDKVYLFDIDYCLFRSNEMKEFERNLFIGLFNKLTKKTYSQMIEETKKDRQWRRILYNLCNFHPREYDEWEDTPVETFLEGNDLELKGLINSLPGRKFCFTNGSKKRVSKILTHLNILDCFEGIICSDTEDLEFIVKPEEKAFRFVENYLCVKNRSQITFFDDTLKNIEYAKKHGWNGYHVDRCIKKVLKEHLKMNRKIADVVGMGGKNIVRKKFKISEPGKFRTGGI